jgi:hypothetical protein
MGRLNRKEKKSMDPLKKRPRTNIYWEKEKYGTRRGEGGSNVRWFIPFGMMANHAFCTSVTWQSGHVDGDLILQEGPEKTKQNKRVGFRGRETKKKKGREGK